MTDFLPRSKHAIRYKDAIICFHQYIAETERQVTAGRCMCFMPGFICD